MAFLTIYFKGSGDFAPKDFLLYVINLEEAHKHIVTVWDLALKWMELTTHTSRNGRPMLGTFAIMCSKIALLVI